MKLKPNHLTLARLALLPGILAALAVGGKWALAACMPLFILSELGDVLDGRLARWTGQVTEAGKLFDPLADSLTRLSMFAQFLALGWMPLWMFLPILWRDIVVAYGRTLHATVSGKALAARKSGKYIKAVPQFAAIVVTIIVEALGLDARIAWGFQLAATAGTVWSGVDYTAAIMAASKGKI